MHPANNSGWSYSYETRLILDTVKLGYLAKDIQQLEVFGNLVLLRAKNDFRVMS